MIHFSLRCVDGHEFEGWFRDSNGFAAQQAAGEIACPDCGSTAVEKALMAPNIAPSRGTKSALTAAQMRAALLELRRQVETHCDYVGENFAEEARKIHYGEADPHGIYGEASEEQSRELAEEGIECGRIPWVSPTDA